MKMEVLCSVQKRGKVMEMSEKEPRSLLLPEVIKVQNMLFRYSVGSFMSSTAGTQGDGQTQWFETVQHCRSGLSSSLQSNPNLNNTAINVVCTV